MTTLILHRRVFRTVARTSVSTVTFAPSIESLRCCDACSDLFLFITSSQFPKNGVFMFNCKFQTLNQIPCHVDLFSSMLFGLFLLTVFSLLTCSSAPSGIRLNSTGIKRKVGPQAHSAVQHLIIVRL